MSELEVVKTQSKRQDLPDAISIAETSPTTDHARESRGRGLLENRWFSFLAMALVVLGGVIPRLNHIGKSLWTSEAWVTNSAISDRLSQVFYYDAWLQTTPPLFLLFVRWAVHFFGLSGPVLRSVPFLLSVLALIFLVALSRQLLRTPFAVLCVSLLALCPPAVVFAKEVKQYSGDLAATCLLLYLAWIYFARPTTLRYVAVLAGLAVALFLSYPAVCFVPLLLGALLFADASNAGESVRISRRGYLRAIPAAFLAAIISGVNYLFFVRPNKAQQLVDFWAEGYPHWTSLKGIIHFYAEYFMGMAVSFYVPSQSKEAAQEFLSAAGHAALFIIAIVFIAALWIAGSTLSRSKHYRRALLLCFLPLVTLAAINLARVYPVGGRRLTLFIFPCIALATSILAQAIWDRVIDASGLDPSGGLAAFLTASCIALVFIVGLHADGWANFAPEDEDVAGTMQFLRSMAAPDDMVYIHSSLAEPAKLYFKILGWDPQHIYFGKTGWPCCTRQVEKTFTDSAEASSYVIRDLENGRVASAGYRDVWLMFTGREEHWRGLRRDEREIAANYLKGQQCREELDRHFTNVELMEFGCSAKSSSTFTAKTTALPGAH